MIPVFWRFLRYLWTKQSNGKTCSQLQVPDTSLLFFFIINCKFFIVFISDGIPIEWYFASLDGLTETKRKKENKILVQEIINSFIPKDSGCNLNKFDCVAYFEGFKNTKLSL
jgi:hypothetical protein